MAEGAAAVKHLEQLVAASTARLFDQASVLQSRVRWRVEARPGPTVASHEWRPSRSAGARERRQMVQACRALRMQIKRFEEEFVASRGHSPRGSERSPLASTYRQYREWKRDIRDHAATQIQSVARGSLSRRALNVVHTLEAPFDIASPKEEHSVHDEAVEHLLREKRRIKQQLKDYDNRFFKAHGRMPCKLEKEPIRDLYERYHALKAKIAYTARSADDAKGHPRFFSS